MLNAVKSFEKLDQLRKSKNMSYYALGKQLEIPSSFFSEWKKGKMMPKNEKLLILANFFNVSINYFLEE